MLDAEQTWRGCKRPCSGHCAEQAADVRQGPPVIGGAVRGALRKGPGLPVDAEHCRHTQVIGCLCAFIDAAHDGNQLDACPTGPAGDACDDQAGALYLHVKIHGVQHCLDVGSQPAPKKRHAACLQVACGACAGGLCERFPQFPAKHLVQCPQLAVQLADHPLVRTLLGPKTWAAPVGPYRGFSTLYMTVTRTPAGSSRVPAVSKCRMLLRFPPTGRKLGAAPIIKTRAQCRSTAAVVGGAAADVQQDLSAAISPPASPPCGHRMAGPARQ